MKFAAIKVPVESSMIKSLTHIVTADILIAEFNNGDKYLYTGVTAPMYEKIITADSVGKEFNHTIKAGGFLYHKI